jgi:hypothetical protein
VLWQAKRDTALDLAKCKALRSKAGVAFRLPSIAIWLSTKLTIQSGVALRLPPHSKGWLAGTLAFCVKWPFFIGPDTGIIQKYFAGRVLLLKLP